MSLLMDALKKAEQEKKEAAKRLREAQDKEGDKLELAGSEDVTGQASKDLDTTEPPVTQAEFDNEELLESTSLEIQKDPVKAVGLSLEPIFTTAEDSSNEDQAAGNAVSDKQAPIEDVTELNDAEEITIEHPELSIAKVEARKETSTKVVFDPDQTFALTDLSPDGLEAPPSAVIAADEDTVQLQGPDEYSETIGGSRMSRTVVSAAELASSIGPSEGHPTPVAAQTVFTAIGRSRVNDAQMWIAFLVFCTVVTVALCVIIYNNNTISTGKLSSPLVAQGVETDPNQLPDIAASQETLTGTIITQPAIIEETLVVQGTLPDNGMQMTSAEPTHEQEEISETVVPEAVVSEASGMMQKAPLQDDMTGDGLEGSPAPVNDEYQHEDTAVSTQTIEKTALSTPYNTLPEKINVEPTAIKISQSRSVDKHGKLINDAYNAYISGNYAIAETGYKKVLEQMPDNRDALLGLAAIAVKQGNLQQAYSGYLKVLKLYPKDKVAQAALINLHNNNDPVKSESVVKFMLQQQPDAPFLYFTLGNLYAVQSRWTDAQQAFFDAYRLDSSNPDYAFNLAVSLDHIGQTSTALDYYNVALKLADHTDINFNPVTVAARIDILSAVTNLK